MKVLLDLTHPAVVHIYLPVIKELKMRGHEIMIVARDKDLTVPLLKEAGLPHVILSVAQQGRFGMFKELISREIGLLRIARRFRPDIISGTSPNAARVAKMVGAHSVIMNEDDASVVPLFKWTAYPFASVIVTPWVLAFENHGARHLTYPAFEKLFYLHRARFIPDPSIAAKLSANSPDKGYVLFRLSALRAHHDAGAKGLSHDFIDYLITWLVRRTNVWISSEAPLPIKWSKYEFPFSKMKMHDALAQAQILICDSQSMSVESAVLGVKSFRLNSFVGRLSVLNELDRRSLSEGFLPGSEDAFIHRIEDYFSNQAAEIENQNKRYEEFLKDIIDPLPWFIRLLEELGNGTSLKEIYTFDADFSVWRAT